MTGQLHSVTTEHSTSGARALGRLNHPASGVVVVTVVPDLRRRYELGWDILAALGKRDDVTGSGRNDDANWTTIPSWFTAHEITDLVLLDAQWLPKPRLADIAELAEATGVDVWLVAHHPIEPSYTKALAAHPVSQAQPADLVATLARIDKMPECHRTRFPTVPRENFPTFLAEARRHLSAHAFERVKKRYDSAFGTASEVFETMPADASPQAQEDRVLAWIRDYFTWCSSTDEMIVVVRAMQAAALRAGWLVNADVARLVVTADEPSQRTVHEPETWQRLTGYRDPYRGAVCALAAADVAINEMTELRCHDISFRGDQVTVQRHDDVITVPVPTGAALFLRAQLAHRAAQGAGSDDMFFADERGPYRARHLSNALRAPILEVGVPLISKSTSWTRVDGARWAQRWGLSVQALA